jgi:asparaginyl-tRNA synthetase
MEPKWVSVKQAYEQPIGSLLKVRGWVRSRRDSKGISFIELNDGSRFKSLQIVAEAGVVPEETLRLVATARASRRSAS